MLSCCDVTRDGYDGAYNGSARAAADRRSWTAGAAAGSESGRACGRPARGNRSAGATREPALCSWPNGTARRAGGKDGGEWRGARRCCWIDPWTGEAEAEAEADWVDEAAAASLVLLGHAANIQHVVAADEHLAQLTRELAIDPLFSARQLQVHV
eukprot:CAMPEP_0115887318 /NCGR_PEP_ID=MMETSP0287-20121206/31700_1 /TAXON_ID=412157 /ORGANISM="Chrysochromulina rotalis, Strain UIO044" /LENGTH=154 /DNA_ID=CAMNT_0003343907 /DNA_START=88 /DNA_END=552 /DNA_ORIENTATION=-